MSSERPIYASHAEFYRAEYGTHLMRSSSAGSITMLEAVQTAGDFSDAATDDLVIIRMLSRAHCHTDFSGGKRSIWHPRGALSVNPAGFANSILVDQPHRIDVACIPWVALRDLDVDDRLPGDGSFGAVHGRNTRDADMVRMFDHLWALEDDAWAGLQSESALVWIGQRLGEWMTWPDVASRKPVEKLSPRSLALSKERLEAVGAETPSLAELATLCRLSPHHFCRAFKAATGLPPHRYQIVARMERARSLLLCSEDTVAEVGTMVGYDDPAYFSRLFTRETGRSPRAWRQERLS